MYEYLAENQVIATIFAILMMTIIIFLLVNIVQKIGLEKIRSIVYDAFIKAEHEFKYGDNTQKFEYVIKLAKDSLPAPFSLFITESLLRKVIQVWFNLCKDLLDDGKVNGTGRDKEE